MARAYLDQLNRDKAITAAHAAAIKSAIENADRKKASHDQLAAAASQLQSDAANAQGRDVERIKALSELLTTATSPGASRF